MKFSWEILHDNNDDADASVGYFVLIVNYANWVDTLRLAPLKLNKLIIIQLKGSQTVCKAVNADTKIRNSEKCLSLTEVNQMTVTQ